MLEEEVRNATASAAVRSMSPAQLHPLLERAEVHFAEEADFKRIMFWSCSGQALYPANAELSGA